MKPAAVHSPYPRLLFVAALVAAAVTVSAQERKSEVVSEAGEDTSKAQPPVVVSDASAERKQAIEELLRRLGPALSQRHHDLTSKVDGEGIRTTSLQGRFHHALVAHVDADGKVHYGCVNSEEGARAFLLNGGAAE